MKNNSNDSQPSDSARSSESSDLSNEDPGTDFRVDLAALNPDLAGVKNTAPVKKEKEDEEPVKIEIEMSEKSLNSNIDKQTLKDAIME